MNTNAQNEEWFDMEKIILARKSKFSIPEINLAKKMIHHRTKWDLSTLSFFGQQALILFIGVVNGSAKNAGTVIRQTVSPNSLSPACSNLTWRTKNTTFYICFDSIVPKHSVLGVLFFLKNSRVICPIPPINHFSKNWFIENQG